MQWLIYASTDMDSESPSLVANVDAPVLTQADAEAYRDLYVPNPADRHHPHASPQRAKNHRDLPPALVQVADFDPLRDDGLRYARTLREAGCRRASPAMWACPTASCPSPASTMRHRRPWPSCPPSRASVWRTELGLRAGQPVPRRRWVPAPGWG